MSFLSVAQNLVHLVLFPLFFFLLIFLFICLSFSFSCILTPDNKKRGKRQSDVQNERVRRVSPLKINRKCSKSDWVAEEWRSSPSNSDRQIGLLGIGLNRKRVDKKWEELAVITGFNIFLFFMASSLHPQPVFFSFSKDTQLLAGLRINL